MTRVPSENTNTSIFILLFLGLWSSRWGGVGKGNFIPNDLSIVLRKDNSYKSQVLKFTYTMF